jgi:hypothetical protein
VPEKELEEFLEENKMKYVTVLVQTLPRKYASSWLNRRVLNSNLKTEALESTYQ